MLPCRTLSASAVRMPRWCSPSMEQHEEAPSYDMQNFQRAGLVQNYKIPTVCSGGQVSFQEGLSI